ncbi:MAG: FAD binding domain-containing protein, partial [Acidobacteria bacterium]|nr:FAD binding domain-containing protein [Acidobacteriota bacterium]
ASEMPGIAQTCEAEFSVMGKAGARTIKAKDFFQGALTTALGADEIITEIHLPDWPAARRYGFQEFAEFLNYAQDKLLVRVEPDADKGLLVYLGAEFYPPAEPEREPQPPIEEEIEEPQPIVRGQPTAMGLPVPPVEEPELAKPRKRVRKAPVKKSSGSSDGNRAPRTTRPRTRKPKNT